MDDLSSDFAAVSLSLLFDFLAVKTFPLHGRQHHPAVVQVS